MGKGIRTLLIFRSAAEAKEVVTGLRDGGFDPTYRLITTPADLSESLSDGDWDVALSDYNVDTLSAAALLEQIRAKAKAIPVIVTGQSIGEERVAALMRAGAVDYIDRGNWERLPAVIERELRATAKHLERKKASEARLAAHAMMEREIQKRNEELHKLNNLLRDEVVIRRQAEEAQAAISQRLAMALRVSRAGSFEWDIQRNTVRWSEELKTVYGFERSDPTPQFDQWLQCVVPEHHKQIEESIEQSFKSGIFDLEFQIRRQDTGDIKWVHCRGQVYFDEAGKPTRMVGINIDVTEHKELESHLHSATQRLEAHVQNSPLAIIEFDGDFSITRWSPAAERVFGWTAAEVLGRRVGEFRWIYEDDADKVARHSREIRKGPETNWSHFNRNYRRDGTVIHCEWYNSAFRDDQGKLVSVFSQVLDVTARVTAETELRRSEERERAKAAQLQTVIEAVPGAIFIAEDPQCRSIRGNSGAYKLLQSPRNNNLSKSAPEDERPTTWQEMKDGKPLLPEQLPMQRAVRGEIVRDFEMDFLFADGTRTSVLCNASPLRDVTGAISGGVAALTDITARRQTEEALRTSELKYRMLHESLRDAFVQVAMDGRIVECNDIYCRMLGYTCEEIRRLRYQDLTPERWHAMEKQIVQEQILPRGYSDIYEKEYRRKDGMVFPVELRTVLSRDATGRPVAMWAIVRDITERKKVEEVELLYRSLLDNAGIAFQLLEPVLNETGNVCDNRYVSVNAAFEALSGGYKMSEIVGRTMQELYPKVEPYWFDRCDRVLKSRKLVTAEHYNRDTDRWYSIYYLPHGEKRIASLFFDVTARKAAELAIEEAEARFKLATRAAHTMVYDLDVGSGRVNALQGVAALLGYEPVEAELTLDWWDRHIHPADLEGCHATFARMMAEPGDHWLRYRVRHRDGRFLHVIDSATPILDDQGRLCRIVGAVTDITQLAEAEEALRQSEEGYRSLFENMAEMFQILEPICDDRRTVVDFRYSKVNRATETLAGKERNEIEGKTAKELGLVVEDYWLEMLGQVLQTGEPAHMVDYSQALDTYYDLHAWKAGDHHVAIFFSNITERRRAETALRESEQRLRAALSNPRLTVWQQDTQLRYVWLHNPVLGFVKDDILGKTDYDLLEPDQADRLVAIKQRVLDNGTGAHQEIEVSHKGASAWFDLTVEPIVDEAGTIVGISCISIELPNHQTKRRIAEGSDTAWST